MPDDSINPCSKSARNVHVASSKLTGDIPSEDNIKLFQCGICDIFSSNFFDLLIHHVFQVRTWFHPEIFEGVEDGIYYCHICTFETKGNSDYSEHSNSKEHRLRLQYVCHAKEGNNRTKQDRNARNSFHCNACEYYANTMLDLLNHVNTPNHKANAKLFLERNASLVKTKRKYHRCCICNVHILTNADLFHHINSPTHLNAVNLRPLQVESQSDLKEVAVSEWDQLSSKSSIIDNEKENKLGEGECVTQHTNEEKTTEDENTVVNSDTTKSKTKLNQTFAACSPEFLQLKCPYCKFLYRNDEFLRIHVIDEHSTLQNTPNCPSIQDTFAENSKLKNPMNSHDTRKNMDNKMTTLSKSDIQDNQDHCYNSNKIPLRDVKVPPEKHSQLRGNIMNSILKDRTTSNINSCTKDKTSLQKNGVKPENNTLEFVNVQEQFNSSASVVATNLVKDPSHPPFGTVSCFTAATRNEAVPACHSNYSAQSSASKLIPYTQFSDLQIKELTDYFKTHTKPIRYEYELLSKKLNLDTKVLRAWFRSKRRKLRISLSNDTMQSLPLEPQIPDVNFSKPVEHDSALPSCPAHE